MIQTKTFKILCLVVLFTLPTTNHLYAQSGCKYNGNYNSILSQLKSRNTRTDRHKLTQGHLENIARYWVADCKCKKGVETMAEAQELYRTAFSNKSHHTTPFLDKGRPIDKDMSTFGDLAPPFAVFTPSSCLKGNNSKGGTSIGDATNCGVAEASRISSLDGQLGAMASQFFAAYCQCKEGVPSKEYEQKLIATMRASWRNFDQSKNATTKSLKTRPLENCKIVESASMESEIDKARRSVENFKMGYRMVEQARERANQLSRDLDQLGDIVNTGNPFEIERDFRRIMKRFEQLKDDFKNAKNEQLLQDGLNTVSSYSSGNAEGALYSGLGILGSIGENMEAKEELEKKEAQIIRQKNSAYRSAAQEMIQANNEALKKYIRAAGVVLQEDREQYYMNKAFYHSCYANSISNNFNYSNANWAYDPCNDVSEPVFQQYYSPLHVQHFEAANRKIELFRKYENEELYQGAIQHMGSAIKLQPKNATYYLGLGRISKGKDPILSLTNYLAANKLQPSLFDENDTKAELGRAVERATLDAVSYIDRNDTKGFRSYLDANLYDILLVDGKSLFLYAVQKDKLAVVKMIFERELEPSIKNIRYNQQVNEALATSAFNGSNNSLQYLIKKGASPDSKYNRKSLLKHAELGNQPETFLLLWQQSSFKQKNLNQYEKTPIYVKAISAIDIEEASNSLCNMDNSKLRNETIHSMIDEGLTKPNYILTLSYCEKSKTAILETDEMQKSVQNLFESSLNSPAVYSTDLLKSDAAEEALSSLSDSQKEMVLKQMGSSSSFSTNATDSENNKSFGNISTLLLKENLLSENYLKSNAIKITERLVKEDNVSAFKIWKQKDLTSEFSSDGSPISYLFLSNGKNILTSGATQHINFNQKDTSGATVLHCLPFALESTNRNYLIASGANVNAEGPHNWTPLHYAVRENDIELVKLLLAAGANSKAKDEWGRTAKKIAKERDFEEILNLL